MAKRRKFTKSSSRAITVRASAPKPIVIRQSAPMARRSTHRRRSSGGGAGGAARALLSSERTGAMIGAALLGLLDKQGTALPTIPVLGRAGTVGVVLWYLGKSNHSPQLAHAATGALSIAAYELTKQGKIDGIDGIDSV